MIFPSRPLLMGIVNVTPDSFSDGGEHFACEQAVAHAVSLLDQGADILDIGGQSTRPPGLDYGEGADVVTEEEELRRVIPVITDIRAQHPDTMISVDTMKPEVARQALEAGASIINDVSAGRYDEEIWKVAAHYNAPCILMHGHNPNNILPTEHIRYYDVVEEVFEFLDYRIRAARRAGVNQVIADVGIGFSKRSGENITLLREHNRFSELGVPLLVGASRKSFIGTLLGGRPPEEREIGSLAAHAIAVLNGATIIRVHNSRLAWEFFRVFNTLNHHRNSLELAL